MLFAKIAEDRSTPDTLIEDSYAMADAIVGFVNEQDLLDLPPTSKMRIEDIPPFLSGYAVAQIVTAPPFQPELPSVWFWDLPLLRTDDSFLKEYNRPARWPRCTSTRACPGTSSSSNTPIASSG